MIYFPLKSKYSSIVLISTVFLYILKLHTFIQHFMENLKSEVHFIFSEVSAWEVFYKHMNIIFYSIWFCFNYVNLFAEMTNFLSTLMYVKWKGRGISLPGQNFDLVFDQLAIYFYCMIWMFTIIFVLSLLWSIVCFQVFDGYFSMPCCLLHRVSSRSQLGRC